MDVKCVPLRIIAKAVKSALVCITKLAINAIQDNIHREEILPVILAH